MGVEIVGSVDQYSPIFSFLSYPIKIISPKNILISSGVIMDVSVVGETFHFLCILTIVKVRCPVRNCAILSPVIELTIQQQTQGYQSLYSDLWCQGKTHCFIFYQSLVLSSELSGSLLSSSSVVVSGVLVKTMAKGRKCLHKLVVGTSLSLSKIPFSLLPETSECVSAHNSHKISSSFRTLLHKNHDCN